MNYYSLYLEYYKQFWSKVSIVDVKCFEFILIQLHSQLLLGLLKDVIDLEYLQYYFCFSMIYVHVVDEVVSIRCIVKDTRIKKSIQHLSGLLLL